AVHERPETPLSHGEFRGEAAELQCRCVWIPLFAGQERSELPLDRGDPAKGLAVTRRDSIPDAPNILPTHVTYTIEEGMLQVVRLIARPAIADVHHVAGFEPFQFADF